MASANEVSIDMKPVDDILAGMGRITSDTLIPLLQKVQAHYGYLPQPALQEVSKRTGIPTSQMYGVITFYEQFHLEPRGRHTVRCCRGTACHVKGGRKIIEAVKTALGVDEGETTGDMRFTFETVACLGTCFLGPVVMIDSTYYGHMKPDRVKKILEGYE